MFLSVELPPSVQTVVLLEAPKALFQGFFHLLLRSREWGTGMMVHNYYGSFPHFLLSSSKLMCLEICFCAWRVVDVSDATPISKLIQIKLLAQTCTGRDMTLWRLTITIPLKLISLLTKLPHDKNLSVCGTPFQTSCAMSISKSTLDISSA